MPLQLPRWAGPDNPPGIRAFVNQFAGAIERALTGGAQLGISAAPNGPASGGLAGTYPGPSVLALKSATAVGGASGATLSAAAILGGVILRSGPSAAFTDTTDTAANLLAAFAPAQRVVGQSADVMVVNETGSTMSIAPGSGVSFAGTLSAGDFTLGAGTTRSLRLIVTSIAAPTATIYG